MARDTITRNEYLQLLGLQTVARETLRAQRWINRTARNITGDQDEFGHTDEMLFNEHVELDAALTRLGITVVDDPSAMAAAAPAVDPDEWGAVRGDES